MGAAQQLNTQQNNKSHIDQELRNARGIYKDAYTMIHNMMAGIKTGKKPNFNLAEPIVENVIISLEKNGDALPSICLSKSKDDYVFKHATSNCILAARFSQHLGFDNDKVKNIALGALFGDIGKMFIPSKILYKPGKLTDNEFETIKKHASFSSKYLDKFGKFDDDTYRAADEHHERVDGTGYPHGLSSTEISVAGQVAAIVDTYDAMTSHRLHQDPREPTETLRYMLGQKEKLFDGKIMKEFIKCIGAYPTGTLVALNNGCVGVVIQQNRSNVMQPVVRLVYDLKAKRTIKPQDIDIEVDAKKCGLRIIGDVSQSRFSFSPLSVIG